MNSTLTDMQKPVAAFLPLSLEQAAQSYREFAKRPAPDESKEFTAYQNACKSALAHIEAIYKLSRLITAAQPKPAGVSIGDDEWDEALTELTSLETQNRDNLTIHDEFEE